MQGDGRGPCYMPALCCGAVIDCGFIAAANAVAGNRFAGTMCRARIHSKKVLRNEADGARWAAADNLA